MSEPNKLETVASPEVLPQSPATIPKSNIAVLVASCRKELEQSKIHLAQLEKLKHECHERIGFLNGQLAVLVQLKG